MQRHLWRNLYLHNSAYPTCGTTLLTGLKGTSFVTSFSIGGSQTTSNTGAKTLTDLLIQKPIDKCSNDYLTEFFTNAPIPTLTLTEVTTGGSTPIYLVITLDNAFIDSYNLLQSGSTGVLGKAFEQISFKYESIKISAFPLDANGNPSPTPVTIVSGASAPIIAPTVDHFPQNHGCVSHPSHRFQRVMDGVHRLGLF